MEEKKVAYSVTKYCGNDNYRYKGIGKLIGTNLHMFGNKVLEDITKYCYPIPYKKKWIQRLLRRNKRNRSRDKMRKLPDRRSSDGIQSLVQNNLTRRKKMNKLQQVENLISQGYSELSAWYLIYGDVEGDWTNPEETDDAL